MSNLAARAQNIDKTEDANDAFIDQVTFAGASVVPVLGPLAGSGHTVSLSGTVATGTAASTSTTDATVLAYFPAAVTAATLTLRNTSTTRTTPTLQNVGVALLRWAPPGPSAQRQ